MDALHVFHQITDREAPGRSPAFSEAHAFKALELIGSGLGVGRQQLAQELSLGEGVIRTMVGRMRALKLIETSRNGMTLTYIGRGVIEALGRLITSREFPSSSITVGPVNHAVLIRSAKELIRKGIEQRDAALMAGALGATTILDVGERLVMPGLGEEVEQDIGRLVYEVLDPGEGDVIIIGSAETALGAEMGALSAALMLLE